MHAHIYPIDFVGTKMYRSKLLVKLCVAFTVFLVISYYRRTEGKTLHCSILTGANFITARRSYASTVLGVVIHLSHTKQCTAHILIAQGRQWSVGDTLFRLKFALRVTHPFEKRRLRQISAYDISTVRDSEKSSIMTNRKTTTGF